MEQSPHDKAHVVGQHGQATAIIDRYDHVLSKFVVLQLCVLQGDICATVNGRSRPQPSEKANAHESTRIGE